MTREMAAQRPLSHRKPQTMELPKQMSSFRGKWTFLSIKITTFIVRCCVHTRRNALKTFKSHLGIWRRILSLMFRVPRALLIKGLSYRALLLSSTHVCLMIDWLITCYRMFTIDYSMQIELTALAPLTRFYPGSLNQLMYFLLNRSST